MPANSHYQLELDSENRVNSVKALVENVSGPARKGSLVTLAIGSSSVHRHGMTAGLLDKKDYVALRESATMWFSHFPPHVAKARYLQRDMLGEAIFRGCLECNKEYTRI